MMIDIRCEFVSVILQYWFKWVRPKKLIFCFSGTFEKMNARESEKFFFVRFKKNKIELDRNMTTLHWIKILKWGWKNKCPGAWESKDQHFWPKQLVASRSDPRVVYMYNWTHPRDPGVIPLATSIPGTISWYSFDLPLNEYYHLIGFILILEWAR